MTDNERVLREAAQAVVDRWDSPAWKDLPATATYINALRAALASTAATRAAGDAPAWQDISTAPKDGTICDLWLKGGGRLTDQWWDVEDKTWCGV